MYVMDAGSTMREILVDLRESSLVTGATRDEISELRFRRQFRRDKQAYSMLTVHPFNFRHYW